MKLDKFLICYNWTKIDKVGPFLFKNLLLGGKNFPKTPLYQQGIVQNLTWALPKFELRYF
jgi:hypothetical protein